MNGNYHHLHTVYLSSEFSYRNNKIPEQEENPTENINTVIFEQNQIQIQNNDEIIENGYHDIFHELKMSIEEKL
jgi:hypothetical protein